MLAHLRLPDADHAFRAVHVLNAPLQTFMNKVFRAEKCSTQAAAALGADPFSDATARACAEAFSRNVKILTGFDQRTVVLGYTRLVQNLDGAEWEMLGFSEAKTLWLATKVLQVLADCWRRLVFPSQEPKRQVFDAVHVGWDRVCQLDRLRMAGDRLVRLAATCEDCVDDAFTKQLAGKLADGATAEATHTFLADIATVVRCSSAAVERHHIVAEETRPSKSRGRALSVHSLGAHSYRMRVVHEARSATMEVRRAVFRRRQITAKSFAKGMTAFKLDSRKRSLENQVRKVKQLIGKKTRRTNPWNVFRREALGCSAAVHTDEFKSALQDLRAAWAMKTPDEKNAYRGRSDRDIVEAACQPEGFLTGATLRRLAGRLEPAKIMRQVVVFYYSFCRMAEGGRAPPSPPPPVE